MRGHQHLVDSVLVEMMRQVAATLREVREEKAAEFLVAVADTLVEGLDSSIEITSIEVKDSDFIKTVAISPDNKILASAGPDKIIKLWNLKNLGIIPAKTRQQVAGWC